MAAAGSAVVVTPVPESFHRKQFSGYDERGQMLICDDCSSPRSPSPRVPRHQSLPSPLIAGSSRIPQQRRLSSPPTHPPFAEPRSLHAPERSSLQPSSSRCFPTAQLMEEDEVILRRLCSPRECGSPLRALLSRTAQRGGRLDFSQRASLLAALPRVLRDCGPEHRPLCVQLLGVVCEGGEPDLEPLRLAVLPELLRALPEENEALQRESVQALQVCLKHSLRPQDLLQALVENGLESPEPSVRRAVALHLRTLLTPDLVDLDLGEVTRCLAKRMCCAPAEEPTDLALETLRHIKRHVGPDVFQSYIQRLPPNASRKCSSLAEPETDTRGTLRRGSAARDGINSKDHSGLRETAVESSSRPPIQGRRAPPSSIPQDQSSAKEKNRHSTQGREWPQSKPCLPSEEHGCPKFGLIPPDLYHALLDPEDYKGRTHAMEELKALAQDFSPDLAPASSVLGLLSFLCNLMDDSNFKVLHCALEVLNRLVLNLDKSAKQYLQPVISATVKVLGDNKTIVRQEYMKTYMMLMKVVGPQNVLCLLLEHVKHKQSRVREEVVNITIVALLTYPSEYFNLPQLSRDIAPCLVDSKRKVRHAALEAFAVLASSMGSNKTSLLKAVDDVELNEEGDGVMNAVQARLARKTLPKLDPHGLVDYAIPLPSSAHGRGAHILPGADTDWLLSGYRTQSAHTPSGDHTLRRYGSYNDLLLPDSTVGGRRVLSAGKGKNKLPWENDSAPVVGLQAKDSLYAKELQQFSVLSDLQAPTLKANQGTPCYDDESGICKKPTRTSHAFKNSLEFSVDSLADDPGFLDHQPFISGKRGQLSFSHTRAKSGSMDSELHLLGTNNHRQDKATIFASLNPASKVHHSYSASVDRTLPFSSSHSNPGSFILPSYPLSSPRASPKQTSPSSGSPKKSQDPFVAFSNSWPLKNFDGRPKPVRLSNQKLGEIAGDHFQETQSPLPLKPALVRTSSRGSLNANKPFPPITRGPSPLPEKRDFSPAQIRKEADDAWSSEKDKKLAIDLSELNVKDDLDHEEMISSLRSLRNSAAKKRAKLSGSTSDLESPDSLKLDLTLDSHSRTSSPTLSPYSESGIYSLDSLTSPPSPTVSGKKISDTFPPNGSKARPARLPSARRKGSRVREQSPTPVLTTNDLSSADVSVVGQRMNYGSGILDFEDVQKEVLTSPLRGHTKEQQKCPKYTKGVFGSPPSPSLPHNQVVTSFVESGDLSSVKHNIEPLSGIYGRAVQQSGPAHHSGLESEKDVKVTISRSARDKMRQNKEQGHIDPAEADNHDRSKNNEKEQIATEGLIVSGDVIIKSKHQSIGLGNASFTTPPLKRASSMKATILPNSGDVSPGARLHNKDRTPSSAFNPEIMDPAELRPFSKPEFALSEALRFLADEDWEKKIEGLNYIRCLSAFHCDVLTAKLHDTSLAVVQEVKNLRSGVSRAAVVCLGDLFTHLKKNMDQELDCVVKGLLHKASESNAFIREDVDRALNAMVLHVTPARALTSLLNGGLSHVHLVVRKCTAQHLSEVVARMGPGRILSGIKDVTDRILPAIAKLAQDSSQETRYYGRKMLFLLMSHPDFDKTLEKYVLPKDLPHIKELVNNLRQKGLGEMPVDTPSAKGRRSHFGSFRGMRSSSTSRDGLNVTERETGESTKKTVPRNLMESAEYIKALTTSLNAQDFRVRMDGIRNLLLDCETNQDLVVTNIVKIFDAFKSRLHDSNSKVNLLALETMQKIIPLLKDSLSAVVNILFPAIVDNNLNSKNHSIYSAASNVVQALITYLDSYLLLPIVCSKAQHLSGKAKQDMTERLADIVMDLYPRKPHAVEQKVLVVLWHLLGNLTNSGSLPGAGGNMRTATAKLSKALFAEMGESLLNQAASQPPHIKNTLEEFLERST
ncbi:TOG array regulator of axonemal microtubules protein 1 isoform X2 [Pleurodeles waltl]|uniref:TOG array regulator of axonemal microtubules protein 1 isoform X2 n=1 Tax=Pleurodeles waltl TaxID=8319 RepID=UPI00370985AC